MSKRIKLRSGRVITTTHGYYDPEDGSFGTSQFSSRPKSYAAWGAAVSNIAYTEKSLFPFPTEEAAIKGARKWIAQNPK